MPSTTSGAREGYRSGDRVRGEVDLESFVLNSGIFDAEVKTHLLSSIAPVPSRSVRIEPDFCNEMTE
jgi:hypothetical protein